MQDFRKLLVWSRSHAFATRIRRELRRARGAGYSDLKTQLTRAAESIPSNIVEGCGAASPKEFARFLDISIKSTSEVEYRLELAGDYGLLAHTLWLELSREAVELRKMLYGLRRTVLAAHRRPKQETSRKRETAAPTDD